MAKLLTITTLYHKHATDGQTYIMDAILNINGKDYPCDCMLEDCDRDNDFSFEADEYGTFQLKCRWVNEEFWYELTRNDAILPREFIEIDEQKGKCYQDDDPIWKVLGYKSDDDSDAGSDSDSDSDS